MKQFTPKTTDKKHIWLLTASLLAVLSVNYGMQTSSLNMNSGEIELASRSIAGNADSEGAAEARQAAMNRTRSLGARVEASAGTTGACDNCDTAVDAQTITLPLAQYNELVSRLNELEKATPTPAAEVVAASADVSIAPPANETAQERRERLAEEREIARQEKAEKEQEEIDNRVAAFRTKVDAIQDKCEPTDVECKSTAFLSILRNYDSRNSIPNAIVKAEFKKAVGTSIAQAMFNPDQQESANSALEAIANSSSRYTATIGETITSSATQVVRTKAAGITQLFAAGNAYTAQNNPQAAALQYSEANSQLQALSSPLAYYQLQNNPDITKIMSSIYPSTTAATTTGYGTQASAEVLNGTRNSRTGNAVNQSQQMIDGKMQVSPNTTTHWNFLPNEQGVQINQPTNTTRGGRGPVRQ